MTAAATQIKPRPVVLCVDDEELVLEGLRDVLHRSFEVVGATSAVDALGLLREDPCRFAIVISDMRMPRMAGSEFLREARHVAPHTVRILLTGYADVDAAAKAVNGGQLFRFLVKPCDAGELMRACAAGLGQHRIAVAEHAVLEETLRGSVDALAEVLALTNPAAFGRGVRVKSLAGAIARKLALPNLWEVEVAAMLAHIGAVTLPSDTATKLYTGQALTPAETDMVQRVPAMTQQLLGKIPRLDGVLAILTGYERLTAAPDSDANVDAQVLRVAVDYDLLESQGAQRIVALGTMQGRGAYDPELLALLGQVVGVLGAATVSEIDLSQLRCGMTLAEDVHDVRDGLLVARGQPVTDHLIERLRNLTASVVRLPLRVYDTQPRC